MTETGMAILLVYGAKIFPPRDGNPGIDVMVDAKGTVKLTAIGYPSEGASAVAIHEAKRTCQDAGLDVRGIGPAGLVVRRKA